RECDGAASATQVEHTVAVADDHGVDERPGSRVETAVAENPRPADGFDETFLIAEGKLTDEVLVFLERCGLRRQVDDAPVLRTPSDFVEQLAHLAVKPLIVFAGGRRNEPPTDREAVMG